MKPRVLISAPYAFPVIQRYRSELEGAGCEIVVASVRERLEEQALLEVISSIDGIICGDDRITERVLAAAPRLKVISKWGTGIDSIDVDAARKRGIPVRNTPNAFSEHRVRYGLAKSIGSIAHRYSALARGVDVDGIDPRAPF